MLLYRYDRHFRTFKGRSRSRGEFERFKSALLDPGIVEECLSDHLLVNHRFSGRRIHALASIKLGKQFMDAD
jgi:hypothetical protein